MTMEFEEHAGFMHPKRISKADVEARKMYNFWCTGPQVIPLPANTTVGTPVDLFSFTPEIDDLSQMVFDSCLIGGMAINNPWEYGIRIVKNFYAQQSSFGYIPVSDVPLWHSSPTRWLDDIWLSFPFLGLLLQAGLPWASPPPLVPVNIIPPKARFEIKKGDIVTLQGFNQTVTPSVIFIILCGHSERIF